jgi:hypothetical protein
VAAVLASPIPASSTSVREPSRVRLGRPSRWALLVYPVPPLLLTPGLYRETHQMIWLVVDVVMVSACWWMFVALRITLTPEALLVRGLRRRRIPWVDIRSIEHLHNRRSSGVQIHTASGSRLRLPAPGTGGMFDTEARFVRDYHRLGQWWLAHQAPSRQAAPQAGRAAEHA